MSSITKCTGTNTTALKKAHQLKVTKYDIPEITSYVQEKAGEDRSPVVSSIAVNRQCGSP